MASISLRDVTKIFDGRVTAVSHLNLEIRDGELLAIVGPSGCGKTTLLRLIAGLETPTAGEIHIGGRVANDLPPRDRDVAMVFQDGALYPHMTIYENLAFPLRMRKHPEAEVKRRIGDAVAVLGIADLLGRKPAALSGGQRQRVALGRALVRAPAAFLFDEPLSSLDAALRLALRSQIKDLHQRFRTTTLYVTHDQSEAMALGERIGVLRAGQLQQVGPPREIYDRPANRFVAGFFGTPPMNFLTARVRHAGEAISLEIGDTSLSLTPPLSSRLSDYKNQMIIVGIRPHDLALEPVPGRGDSPLAGRVVLVEHLGARVDVHVELSGGQKCILSAPSHVSIKVGDQIPVYIPPDKLHLFEPDEPGARITLDVSP